jgi:hypothetical protein
LPLGFGVKGFGGVARAFRTPFRKRSSAPGSSLISGFLGDFAMTDLSLLARSVPESTLARIGAVMVLWGAIEHHMDRVLWRLLEVDISIGRKLP